MECLDGQSHEEEETVTKQDKKLAQPITSMFLLGLVSCVLWVLFLISILTVV